MFVASCGNSNDKLNFGDAKMMNYDLNLSEKTFAAGRKMESASNGRVDNVTVERKLIKTGNITFETKELEDTRKTILDLVTQNKGYLARDNQYKSDDRISTTLSVRIPAESFDKVLEGIAKGVEKFDNKNISISDVTEQFLDVEARLKTKKALEIKYLEILKKARTVREILDVERELAKVRGDIEAKEGRLKYLQSQVSFSTLSITFYKKTTVSESVGFGSKITNAFKQGFQNVKAFLVSIINVWPFIIVLFLLIFYFRRRMKRKKS